MFQVERLKALKEQNARLKKLLAAQMLDAAAAGGILSKMVGASPSAMVSRICGP